MSRATYYILSGHEPVAVTAEEWARGFDKASRVVARTELAGGLVVSTVFLGMDHNWLGKGPPALFETMVFCGPEGRDTWRYATWAEAELGHMEVVESLEPVSGDPRAV